MLRRWHWWTECCGTTAGMKDLWQFSCAKFAVVKELEGVVEERLKAVQTFRVDVPNTTVLVPLSTTCSCEAKSTTNTTVIVRRQRCGYHATTTKNHCTQPPPHNYHTQPTPSAPLSSAALLPPFSLSLSSLPLPLLPPAPSNPLRPPLRNAPNTHSHPRAHKHTAHTHARTHGMTQYDTTGTDGRSLESLRDVKFQTLSNLIACCASAENESWKTSGMLRESATTCGAYLWRVS